MRILITVLIALALSGCERRSEWQELAISEAGFSVLMRGQPHYTRQQLDTPAGKMQAHLYSSDRPDAFYAVGYADYPLALALTGEPQSLFAGVRDTWVRRINGRLIASGPTKLETYPGLEFTARGTVRGNDAFLEARLYLVDQRLYQIVAIARTSEVPQGIVNRFLKSFRRIPEGGRAEIHLQGDTK